MKMPTFLLAISAALTLCGCATVSQPPHESDSARVSPPPPGTQTISGEDIKKSGRPNTDDALRSLSPIFH
jgi:hypothetical protein